MKKVIELEGLTIIGEVEELEKLRQVIIRGSVHFFERADNAGANDTCLVHYWTHMGQYAYRLYTGIDKQIKEALNEY